MTLRLYRINRNIMECKENNLDKSIETSTVLIETLWNVKSWNS